MVFKMKVLITDNISEEGIELLKKEKDIKVDIKTKLSEKELLDIVGKYDALITRSGTAITKKLLNKTKNLKIIGRSGVGVDNIDIVECSNRGIVVVNAPLGNTNSAAEHTMAMMLTLCRNITEANKNFKKGEWDRKKYIGMELKGKTLGIIGFGKIGSRVGIRCKSFKMEVIANDPYIPEKKATDLGVMLVSKEELIKKADIITVHTPLNEETSNLVAKKDFQKMKDGVLVLNIARGGIINEKDLLDALNTGKVKGAAIDVWSEEPPKDETLKKLIKHEKVIVTPHLGANTMEAQINVAVDVVHQIINLKNGKLVENALNIPLFKPELMRILEPYMNLGERIGKLCIVLNDGNINTVNISIKGELANYDTAPIKLSILKGLLEPISDERVNLVNSGIITKRLGINVIEMKTTEEENYTNLISVRIETKKSKKTVEGTLFEGKPKIVMMRDYDIEFDLKGLLLVMCYNDVPGIIGKIGTILGDYNINIASMSVGRKQKKGKAFVVLNLDDEVPDMVQEKIRKAVNAEYLKQVKMD